MTNRSGGRSMRRPSHERDRRLLDTMPQCIWAADADGRVSYWNRAGLEYCGLDAASLTEGSFWEMLHVDDRAEARVHWERGLRAEPTFERQVRLRRASDGLFRWHLVRAVAERDDAGAVLGWIATATDIDDQKRAEDLLREAVHLRDDFLSVASHELRTPLTALKLEVSNLLRLARLDAGSERARLIAKVEKIDAQTARLRGLIDDLLDVSSLAAGQLELADRPGRSGRGRRRGRRAVHRRGGAPRQQADHRRAGARRSDTGIASGSSRSCRI